MKAVIVTHRSAPTHGEEIKQYFISQKYADVWFVANEFAQLPTRRTYIEHWQSGKQISINYSPNFSWIPEPLIYIKDILFSSWYLLSQVKQADFYLGISAFDTLPGIFLRSFLKLQKLVFLTIDFVPQRFSAAWLNSLYITIDRFCINKADQTWNPSPRMMEGREKVWGYPKSMRAKQSSFPFGIWLDKPPEPKLKSKTPLLLFSGHLLPKQGVQLAISALPTIIKKIPNLHFSVVGAGEYETELKKLAQDLHVSSYITFHGRTDNKAYFKLLRQAWLGLSTFDPKLDTFSYYADPAKIKMYLGSGLPVILTDIPYIAKEIQASQAGAIVPYDAKQFAKVVINLLKDKQLLCRYSQNAWKMAQKYDWDKVLGNQLSQLFDHHPHQIGYFTKEFAQIKSYSLAPWQAGYIARILSHVSSPPDKTRVIDIASGSGYVAIELAKKGYSVTATDLTPESVRLLNKYKQQMKLKNLQVIQSPAEKIPLPSKAFDVIVANAILEHIPAEADTIKEWLRLLKPKGTLVITVPLKFRYIWPMLWYHNKKHDRAIGHLRRYDVPDLVSKIPLRFQKAYYTGNIFKITGIAANTIFKSKQFERVYEYLDGKTSGIPYGANNLMVVFKNIA